MNRLTTGMVPLLALLVAVGCSGDPTGSFRGDTARIDAAPTQLFLQLGESKTVDVSAVDDQGNQISSVYEVTATGPGITVRRDSTFLPQYGNDSTLTVPPQATVFRFVVTATGYGSTDFTVSANGKDATIPVHVGAQTDLDAQISNLNPALNEPVTITAPAGITFSPTSQVRLSDSTAVQPSTVSVAADGSSITFLPAPNITDQALIVTDVVSASSPGHLFAPATVARITTPSLTAFDGTVSNLAPAANQPVTIALNNASFDPASSVVTVGADTAVLIGATATSATFIPKPGGTGLVFFSGVVIDSLPQFTLTLTNAITDTLHVGPAGTTAGTDAPGTAPSLAVPDPGFAAPFFDAADFDASADHFYKLVVTAAGDYSISLNWDVGSDIDMFLCPSPGTITGACDFQAATGNQPEAGVYTLTPGTYYVVAEDFGGDAHLSNISITVSR
jgi:hypothetical protein